MKNELKVQYVPIDAVVPYENNPRDNDGVVTAVANSIREFGFKVPIIVDKDMTIIAGHTRLKAAQYLELKEIPVVMASDLTEEQARAFRLADNKTGELASWDFSKLEAELDEITGIDMELFGFKELEDSFSDDDSVPSGNDGTGYTIFYEIIFNDEQEKEEWYEFMRQIKAKWPDDDTISERIIKAVKEWEKVCRAVV